MSNALVIDTLMDDGLIPAINAAWGNPTIGEDSMPRTLQDIDSRGFVALSWEEVHIQPAGFNAGFGSPNQAYQFEILYFFLMPQATGTTQNKLSRVKARYASQLIAQIQTGPTFAGIANWPWVERVSGRDREPIMEGAAMIKLVFTCQVQATHH